MHIEQITPELTWQLRRDVLYPQSKLFEMEMDEDARGMHFGGFADNQLVCIVSLFIRGSNYQFRKFAVATSHQGLGHGRELLNYIISFSKSEGATRIWCNARLPAIGFYLKTGFVQTGETFTKNDLDYEILEMPF